MIETAANGPTGLIVEIGDGDSYGYRGHLFYDLTKTTVIRLAFAMARELRKKNVAAVALTPGFLRSEAMLEHFGVTEENWRDAAKKDPNYLASETPLFVGRAVAALLLIPICLKSPAASSAPGASPTNTLSRTPTAFALIGAATSRQRTEIPSSTATMPSTNTGSTPPSTPSSPTGPSLEIGK